MYTKYAKLRDEYGFNDATVAEKCGIANSTISDWKNGISIPKLPKIAKIAKLFNVPIEYFVDEQEEG